MPRERNPMVYLLASARNGTLYAGVTSDLVQRVYQHREGAAIARDAADQRSWFPARDNSEIAESWRTVGPVSSPP